MIVPIKKLLKKNVFMALLMLVNLYQKWWVLLFVWKCVAERNQIRLTNLGYYVLTVTDLAMILLLAFSFLGIQNGGVIDLALKESLMLATKEVVVVV